VLALAEEPATWRYGYELCQRLGLKAGSVYPILMRLADRGLLETAWERDAPAGRPPPWLLGDRHARRFGVGVAIALVAGFILTSRLGLGGVDLVDAGMLSYLLFAAPLVVLAGSAAAAAGRSFRTGLWTCAWATVLGGLLIVVAWLAEAPSWYRQAAGCSWTRTEGSGGGPTWAMPSGGP
jgi:hypothetical protein